MLNIRETPQKGLVACKSGVVNLWARQSTLRKELKPKEELQ
jgi:hypothetical protein